MNERDVWREIDELRADQDALHAEWQRTKAVVAHRAGELQNLTAAIKASADGIEAIAQELRALTNG